MFNPIPKGTFTRKWFGSFTVNEFNNNQFKLQF